MRDRVVWLALFLIVIGLVALAIWEMAKRAFRLDADSRSPKLTADAAVAALWREDCFQGTKYRKTRIRTCYAAFLLEGGVRVELWLGRRAWRRLTEGSAGRLTWQGSRFIRFEPAGETR